MQKIFGVTLTVTFVGVVLAGCASGQGENTASAGATSATPQQSGGVWRDEIKVADSADTIGGTGSPCALPISFQMAKSWKAQAVHDNPLGKLAGFSVVCELDAKPAGLIGFIRVWTQDQTGDTPRQALDTFLAKNGKTTEQQFRDINIAGHSATEVSYLHTFPEKTLNKHERILALTTGKTAVLLVVSGLDDDEYSGMLPAYMLAKQSLKLNA